MKLARKIKRQRQQKEKKVYKKAFKTVSKRFEMLGQSCRACGKEFDTSNQEHLDSWKVYIQDEDPRLVCPTCNEEIIRLKNEMIQTEEEDEIKPDENRSREP